MQSPYYSGKTSLALLCTGTLIDEHQLLKCLSHPGPLNPNDPFNLYIIPGKNQPKAGHRKYVSLQDAKPIGSSVEYANSVLFIAPNHKDRIVHREHAKTIAQSLFQWQTVACKEPRLEVLHIKGNPRILGYIAEALRRERSHRTGTRLACHDGIEAMFNREPLNPEIYSLPAFTRPPDARRPRAYDPFDL